MVYYFKILRLGRGKRVSKWDLERVVSVVGGKLGVWDVLEVKESIV